jgi:penicillin-binding protein 2
MRTASVLFHARRFEDGLLDRKGRVLATSKLTYSLYLEPRLVSDADWPELRNRLASLLNLDPLLLDQRRDRGTDRDGYRTTLMLDLKPEQVLRFREQALALRGAQVDVDILRFYPHGSLAAHALGYTQPITDSEYDTLVEKGYKIRDRIGRTGVEAAYETHLRGKWGGQMLEVNAMGEVQRNLGDRPSESGQDLTLTLDLDLQRAAEQALADKPGGAVVALEAKTGAVLALASKPGFDPNFFSKLITTQKEYDALFLNPNKPLLSRAMNPYDPGSTWKPVTAMAGMESGKFPPTTKLQTKACITYGGHCFPDHNGAGFGQIGYADALRFSSNTFFYQVGVGVGSRALKQAANQLGFQQKTGIEIDWEESVGLVGDEDWAENGRGWADPGSTPWIPEDMASASIGQSVVQITPLQLARAYAVFANGGWLVTPHLAKGEIDWMAPQHRRAVLIKPSTLETIRKGLRKVVEDGTGYGLNGAGIPLRLEKRVPPKTVPVAQTMPGLAVMPRIPTAKLLLWPSLRTPQEVVPCTHCRWRRKCLRRGNNPAAKAEPSGSSVQCSLAKNVAVVAPQLFSGASPAPAFGF